MARHQESQHYENANEDSDEDNTVDDENTDDVDTDDVDTDDDGEDEVVVESDEDEKSIWEILKDKAEAAVGEDGEVNDSDENDAVTDVKESDNAIVQKISHYYVSLLRLHTLAKGDETHKKIMLTKKRMMEEEDFDELEALYSAAKLRKLSIAHASGINLISPIDMEFID